MNNKIMKAPLSVCWNITEKCNDSCKFCFRNNVSKHLSLYENNFILDKFLFGGIKKISWIGGEPLMYDGVDYLISKAKRYGVITSITTNGILVDYNWLKNLEGSIDWITLSLDGSNSKMQTEMSRNARHFEKTIEILEMIRNNNLNYNVKINTVASKINLDDIENISEIIKKYNIKRWKIFKFYPVRGHAVINKDKFAITMEEYNAMEERIKYQFRDKNDTKINFLGDNELDDYHFIVFSDGSVSLTSNEKDIIKGNILENSIDSIWSHYFKDSSCHIKEHNWLING